MKRVLMLASVASMIDQFNMPNIALLQKLGYEVDVACNFIEGNTCSDERVAELKQKLQDMHVHCYQIDFARNIKHMGQNMKALWQVEALMKQNTYEFCHCHSPIGGVVARIAGHRTRTKVIYTAHGFHFYQGAPIVNWLVYYPVEKVLSRWTEVLITINHEDYALAKKKFHAKKTYYLPGIGIDLEKFHVGNAEDIEKKRQELGLHPKDIFLLSVGEISDRKNHVVVIEAMKHLVQNYPQLKYFICGQGEKKAGTAAVDSKISFGRSCETVGISDRRGRTLSGSRRVCVPVKTGGTSGSIDGSDGLWGSGSVQQNSGKHRSGKKWRERSSGKRRSAGRIYSGN